MEKDKLAKTMQGLPGVLTQVYFADIRDAMTNFHETMKLGRGGFRAGLLRSNFFNSLYHGAAPL
jgi:hypothetical protein